MACEDDKTVPVENSLRMYRALRDNKVEAEMVLVPQGGHGWGFEKQIPKRDLVDASITQFIYAQLGDKKNADNADNYNLSPKNVPFVCAYIGSTSLDVRRMRGELWQELFPKNMLNRFF